MSCTTCGAALAAGAGWCGQCYALAGAPAVSTTGVVMPFPSRPTTAATLPQQQVRSRWRKTQTTFGPVGRVVATVLLVIPFVIMLVGGLVGDIFALVGAGIWLFVIMPWALRDIWRAGLVLPDRGR